MTSTMFSGSWGNILARIGLFSKGFSIKALLMTSVIWLTTLKGCSCHQFTPLFIEGSIKQFAMRILQLIRCHLGFFPCTLSYVVLNKCSINVKLHLMFSLTKAITDHWVAAFGIFLKNYHAIDQFRYIKIQP